MRVYPHPAQPLSHHSPPGHAGSSLSPALASGLIFLSLILLLASEQLDLTPSQGSAGREGRKVQLCQHQGCWHGECCCAKADAQPRHWLALVVPLGGGVVCQFWAEGEVKRQPSSESTKEALRTFLWGRWATAQPAGSPMAPVPPTLLHAGAVAAAHQPQSDCLGGALSSDTPFQPKKVPWGVCGLLPRCPRGCPWLSCSPHCLLQRQPQAGQGDAGGLSEGRSKCLLVALCPRGLGLLV